MRIATSTIYSEQTTAIEQQVGQYQQLGTELSTGKSLNVPSDNPNLIGPDVLLHATIASETQDATAATGLNNELTTVDTNLNALTNALQSARTLAVQGASTALSSNELKDIGGQVDQLLNQVVSLANQQYAGNYLFAGSKALKVPPVQAQGQPTTSVSFLGNNEARTQVIAGRSFQANVTLQGAFNYNAADGSGSVFSVLQNLRDTLDNGSIVDQSATAVNKAGTVITPATTLGTAGFAVPLTTDNAAPPRVTIELNATDSSGANHIQDFTLNPAVDTLSTLTTAINTWATANGVGITAAFTTGAQNAQRFSLTSTTGSFYVKDVPSPGATTSGNLSGVLGLSGQADLAQNVSTQLGDIDKVLQVALGARAQVGARIQSLSSLAGQIATFQTDNIKVQSSYEDTNIAQATSQFSLTQTALQAAYATTGRLEGKTLIDYVQ